MGCRQLLVRPAAGFNLTAQIYRSTDADDVMDSANTAGLTGNGANGDSDPVSRSASAWCDGVSWQKVTFALPLAMKNNKYLDANESLGVRSGTWAVAPTPTRSESPTTWRGTSLLRSCFPRWEQHDPRPIPRPR